MPVVSKSSRTASNATSPLLLIDGGLKPKAPNGPLVSATVVNSPPSPVTMAETNWSFSSKNEVSKATVP
jgi:hypothetical protein